MSWIGRRAAVLLALTVVGLLLIGLVRLGTFEEALQELRLPLRHENIIRAEASDPDVARLASGAVELPAIEPDLVAAVIYAESRFRDQTSSAGARGLMQITPDTADTIEKLSGGTSFEYDDLADPDLNIRYGTFYLRFLLDRYEGNEVAVLAAYNAGEGNVDAWGGASLTLEQIQFEETAAYVAGILDKRREYRREYGPELGLR